MLRTALTALVCVSTLAACASPAKQARSRAANMAERTLDRLEQAAPIADPGLVVAADIAFARAARDTDLLSAMRAFATADAVRHSGKGAIDLETSLIGHPPIPVAERWAPNSVWSSCNGRSAISFGKFLTPDGITGTYAALWQRQPDRAMPYKWAYRLAAKDARQPPPRPAREELAGDDVIVVEELSSINARTADCAVSGDAERQPPPVREFAADSVAHTGRSDDGTLSWAWEHRADGTRVFSADYLRGGVWEEVVNLVVTGAGVQSP